MRSPVWASAVALFLTAGLAPAGIWGVLPLTEIYANADAVVIAHVVRFGAGTPVVLEIDESIEGELQRGTVIEATVRETFESGIQDIGTLRGLWFLASEGRQWRILPVEGGEISFDGLYYRLPPALHSPLLAADPSLTGLDRILARLSALPADNVRDRYRVPAAMAGLRSEGANRMLQAASDSKDLSMRALGLSGRICRSEAAAVVALEREVQSGRLGDVQEIALSFTVDYRNPDPKGIAAMSRLVVSDKASVELRHSVAMALAAIHSPGCLGAFLKMMDSPAQRIRYWGAHGMALYANNSPMATAANVVNMAYMGQKPGEWSFRTLETMKHVPGLDSFAANEQKYLSFWKRWASEYVSR